MQGREQRQKLAFACLPTVAHFYLPDLMDAFANEHPKIAIRMQDQPAGRITELVLSGEVEFGVTLTAAQPWDLEFAPIRRESYNLLVGPKHRLARKSSITRADLAGERFVRINTQSTNRKMVDDFLGPVADQIDWKFEVQNATLAMALVLQGAAVTVLPQLTAQMGAGNLVGLPFSDIEMYRTLGIVTRRGAPLSDAAQKLRDMIVLRLGQV
jgi:DNA-binding transcriptional LysR family regulator